MSIETHVVSLETAKRMKELGWKKICVYTWREAHFSSSTWDDTDWKKNFWLDVEGGRGYPRYFAPLATEIMEELPVYVLHNRSYLLLEVVFGQNKEIIIRYADIAKKVHLYIAVGTRLVEALALLWCELKEKGII